MGGNSTSNINYISFPTILFWSTYFNFIIFLFYFWTNMWQLQSKKFYFSYIFRWNYWNKFFWFIAFRIVFLFLNFHSSFGGKLFKKSNFASSLLAYVFNWEENFFGSKLYAIQCANKIDWINRKLAEIKWNKTKRPTITVIEQIVKVEQAYTHTHIYIKQYNKNTTVSEVLWAKLNGNGKPFSCLW